MFDQDRLLAQYLNRIESEHSHLYEYFKAYQWVVDKFGYEPIIDPGRIQLLGWDLEYLCGANLSGQIDATLIRRQNDFIPENDHPLILDCGANIGITVLNYKRQFPKARIITFEPDPEVEPILRRNMKRNGVKNVEVIDAAVWVENGTAQWYCEGVDGSHLNIEPGETTKTITVRTVDLRDYLKEPVDLIKLDIEGAEYEVVIHISKQLRNVKAMSIECHLDQRTMSSFGKMLTVLSDAGFQVSIGGTIGPWRDLIHQPLVFGEHHENYLLVSAWRGSIPSALTRASWISSVGVAPIIDHVDQMQHTLHQASVHEVGLLNLLKSYSLTDQSSKQRTQLKGIYQQEIGLCWRIPLADFLPVCDDAEHPDRSTLLLYEDGKLLHHPHAVHEDIRSLGGGRYSHWNGVLYFSTSDGSNPNTNGRQYQIVGVIDMESSY